MKYDNPTVPQLNQIESRAESNRPLTDRVVRPPAAWAAGFALAFVVFGSLTPFSVNVSEMRRMGLSAIGQLGWPHSDIRDVAINVGVYLPIGFTLWILLAARCSRPTALSITILAGTMLSFTLETLQQFVATRYPSWIDVMVNATGTATGAVLAWLMMPLFLQIVLRLLISNPQAVPVAIAQRGKR